MIEKTKYVTSDGFEFEANNAEEAISILNKNSMFGEAETTEEFMQKSAERIKLQTGIIISKTSDEGFLTGLLESGLISKA